MPRITAAERKRQEADARDRAVHAALAWPQEPCPQPYSKEWMDELTKDFGYGRSEVVPAWTYNTARQQPMRGCFGRNSHSVWSVTETTSQTQGGPWFATEAEARLALRWAVCREMAETLRGLVEAEVKAVVREGTIA